MLIENTSVDQVARRPAQASGDPQTLPNDRFVLLGSVGVFIGAATLAHLVVLVVAGPVALAVSPVIGGAVGAAVTRRITPPWIGTIAWVSICAAATTVTLVLADADLHRLTLSMCMVAIATVAAVAMWVRDFVVRRHVQITSVAMEATRIFAAPTTGLAPLVAGAGIALPLFGTYAPNITDSDSSWMTGTFQLVRGRGIEYLQRSHDALVPHLTLSPLQAIDGHRWAMLFTIATMIGLSALVAYIATQITGHGAAAIAAPAALLTMPVLVQQTDYYPMYALAYLFAYGSVWLLHRAMSDTSGSVLLAITAGAGFVLSYESHSAILPILMMPFILLILHPWTRARRPLLINLATILVVSLPRMWINLSVGGFEGIRNFYDNSWFVRGGYLREVNQNFHGQNAERSAANYLSNIPGMIEDALGGRGFFFLLAVPALLAFVHAGRQARMFGLVTGGMFFLALVVASPATYSRYVTPLAAAFAIVAAVGVVEALREPGMTRLLGQASLVVLVLAGFTQMNGAVADTVARHESVTDGPLPTLANLVDDDKAVLGVRSHLLGRSDPSILTFFPRTMTEDDFVTFLSWPSDDDIADLVEREDIGWVFVIPSPSLEMDYHRTWLEPHFGVDVQHPLRVADSDDFCLVIDLDGYRLYRYGECQPGDEGLEGLSLLGSEDPRLNPFRDAAGLPRVFELPAEEDEPA